MIALLLFVGIIATHTPLLNAMETPQKAKKQPLCHYFYHHLFEYIVQIQKAIRTHTAQEKTLNELEKTLLMNALFERELLEYSVAQRIKIKEPEMSRLIQEVADKYETTFGKPVFDKHELLFIKPSDKNVYQQTLIHILSKEESKEDIKALGAAVSSAVNTKSAAEDIFLLLRQSKQSTTVVRTLKAANKHPEILEQFRISCLQKLYNEDEQLLASCSTTPILQEAPKTRKKQPQKTITKKTNRSLNTQPLQPANNKTCILS